MKALITKENGTVEIADIPQPKPREDEILVKIHAAALNRKDHFIREGKYPRIKPGVALGADGCGMVQTKDHPLFEQDVVINPNVEWGDSEIAQSDNYRILGMPDQGTFSEYIAVKKDRVFVKPAHLSIEEAAALPLGGLTAFRACFYHGEIKSHHKVLVTGAGGGVAQFAVQFANAAGAAVYVTSGSDEKVNAAKNYGAKDGVNYHHEDWYQNLKDKAGSFDVIIDSAGGNQWNYLIDLLAKGGRLVFYGASTGKPENINVYKMFWRQQRIQGSTMGSDQDFENMLLFVEKHKIKPIVDSVWPFDKIIEALDKLKEGKQRGKIVIHL